jgi:hypothetical protein
VNQQSPVVPAQRPSSTPSFTPLRATLVGALLEPHDEGYDALVTPWKLTVPMRPSAVVAARTGGDVAATVRFAGEHGLTVGVQATGHGAVASVAGSVLVSTKDLDEVVVHPEGWARVGAGVKWLRVIQAAAPHGLAPLCGSASDVSVVGYTTGGGVGPMARTHGLAADKVRAFEVVTGDGVLHRVKPTSDPELFFALRGGKGSAGIVTAVEFDLVEMATFYGGALYFDGDDAAAVIDAWRSWSAALPEQATTSFALLQLPPMPMVPPPPLAGRLTLALRFLWTGDAQEGQALLDQMRVAPVLIDDVAVKPFAAIDSVHADPVQPMPAYEAAMLLEDFDAQAAQALLAAAGPGSGSPQIVVEVRQLGGALGRQGLHSSAFDHRSARYNLFCVGIELDPRVPGHAAQLMGALEPWGTGGTWPNFLTDWEPASIRRAYAPATLEKLAAVSAQHDPHGVLAGSAATRTAALVPA